MKKIFLEIVTFPVFYLIKSWEIKFIIICKNVKIT